VSGVPERRGLRVLITNRQLNTRTGTETYVRDLALGLLERGHSPVVFSPLLGELAAEIRAATVPVTCDLATVAEPPDVIHGHHGPDTLAALLAFPGVPAVAFCHSWLGWPSAPLRFPRILRHVAVDHTCRDRLCAEHGIPPGRVHVILNSVDLARFRPRPPLPPRPLRALVLSNAAGAAGSHLGPIRAACAAEGIEVVAAGSAAGRPLAAPEEVLAGFDLVFAKARAALEAMAVGAAVILCDAVGAGPMVTSAELPRLRALNFGMRTLRRPVTAEVLRGEIARYDAADAAAVSQRIRAEAGSAAMVDELCALYETVIAEQRAGGPADAAAEMRAAAQYVQWLSPRLVERDALLGAFHRALRTPLLGTALRRLARSPSRGHWVRFLLERQGQD
jgi:hypothetical protein